MGLILCVQKDVAIAHYSLENLPNKVVAREYRLALPDEKLLAAQLERTQRALEARAVISTDRDAEAKIKKKVSKRSEVSRKRTKRKK